MGETGLPGFDECNYAITSAAGVNSLPSQLALVARALRLRLPQLHATQTGPADTHTHCMLPTDQPPLQAYSSAATATPPTPRPPTLLIGALELFMQTPMILDEYVERKGARTHICGADTHQYDAHVLKHPPTLLWAVISASFWRFSVERVE